jgi:hypothetical protein
MNGRTQLTGWLFLAFAILPYVLAAKPLMQTVRVADLRPSQFSLGGCEVRYHVGRYGKKISDKNTVFEDEDPDRIQVVLAPDGDVYIVDGHHHLAALDELGVKRVRVAVMKDWSRLPNMDVFWEKMANHQWVYLRDEKGKQRSVRDLPESLHAMADDPFRSIAWLVRKSGGYDKTDIPFAEFRWAEYFRSRIPLRSSANSSLRRAVQTGIELARQTSAEALPGYHPYPKSDCAIHLAQLAGMLP